jgi:hypothetical protein
VKDAEEFGWDSGHAHFERCLLAVLECGSIHLALRLLALGRDRVDLRSRGAVGRAGWGRRWRGDTLAGWQ